jgi:hypothetical protein
LSVAWKKSEEMREAFKFQLIIPFLQHSSQLVHIRTTRYLPRIKRAASSLPILQCLSLKILRSFLSEISNPSVITPIPSCSIAPPPKRFILRPPNLARLGINIALKLRGRPSPHIRMELLSLLNLLAIFKSYFRSRVRRLVDLRS